MTDERFEELRRLVTRPDAYGFRSECGELLAEVAALREANYHLRTVRYAGEVNPRVVFDQLDAVARRCDSALHEAAALMIQRLMRQLAEAEDAASDRRQSCDRSCSTP